MGIATQSETCLFHFRHLDGNSRLRFIPAFTPGEDKNKSFILKYALISKLPIWFCLLPPASSNDSWKKLSFFFSTINLEKKEIFFLFHFDSFQMCTRFKKSLQTSIATRHDPCQASQTYCEIRSPVISRYSCHLNPQCCKQAVAGSGS